MINGELRESGKLLPYSITPLMELDDEPAPGELVCKKGLLENKCLRVELNSAGDITSIFDKISHREVLPEGTGSTNGSLLKTAP